MRTLKNTEIDRLIDKMNEIESKSDRVKLPKSVYNRYWYLHKIIFLDKGVVYKS
jgi:hypothetical protein